MINQYKKQSAKFLLLAILALGIAFYSAPVSAQEGPIHGIDPDGIEVLQEAHAGQVEVSVDRTTGAASFVRIPRSAGSTRALDGRSPEEKATQFLRDHGSVFGIQNLGSELSLIETKVDALGNTRLTYQQLHQGVEVFGALLRVHVDQRGGVSVANGTFVPQIKLSTVPSLSAQSVGEIATRHVLAQRGVRNVPTGIVPLAQKLYVFRAGLARGISGSNHLVYEVEVANLQLTVREFIYVDAHSGLIVDQISGIHEHEREISEETLDNVIWDEGNGDPDPIPSDWLGASSQLIEDWRNEADGAKESYNFFASLTGGAYLSYDGNDAIMRTVNNDPTINCPNANWNGTSTNYCTGVTGDDTVAHEWGHAYTQFTSDLIYQWQPGGLNESYSDIWGEAVDLLNSRGADSPNMPRTPDACSIYQTSVPPVLTINAPDSIAGSYDAGGASFGAALTAEGITGNVVLADDGTGDEAPPDPATTDACEPLVNADEISGNIALIDRGSCAFTEKVKSAQDAGAIAVIIANHVDGGDATLSMGGEDAEITIPALSIGYSDSVLIKEELATGVNATLQLAPVSEADDSYRWLSGEDDPAFGGAIRDMWNPTCFGHPGKVSDEEYHCTVDDNGGVHRNSGVPNHAFALMVDGGTYNGFTIPAIGLTKASHIHWRANSVYEGPISKFPDHADALETSCMDLINEPLYKLTTNADEIGVVSDEVISEADCNAVAAVIAATEMRLEPTQCDFQPAFAEAPALCQDLGEVETLLSEDWESGSLPEGWTVGTHDLVDPSMASNPDWSVVDNLPDARGGFAAFVPDTVGLGDCVVDVEAGAYFLDSPLITLPEGVVVAHVAIDHLFGIELGWDGGNFKISVNGGPYQLIPAANFSVNPYNGSINDPNDNPLLGEPAFTGGAGGEVVSAWGQSQINLFGLAGPGDTIQIRADFGVDGCNGVVGWYLDDFQVYACSAEVAGQFCGNKAIDTAETCDDGNTEDGDGCSSICLIEDNYTCELPTDGANVVQDGSFEAGTPNPVWTEFSTNFTTPLCDGGCGGPGSSDGDWYVWFGGVLSYEEGSMEQAVMIPNSATTLDFDLWVGGCNSDSQEDGLSVLIDGSELFTTDPCTVAGGYERQSIDISDYADDSVHTVRFEALSASPNEAVATNIFVDNVTISDNLATGSVCVPTSKVIISESEGVSAVVEGSADPAGYTVVLSSKPEGEVVIQTVEHQNQVTRSPEEIVFDASNWNVPQLIQVTGVVDDVEEGDHEAYIWHRVKSSDPQYGDDVSFSGNGYTAQSDPRTVLVYISEPSENATPAVSASMLSEVAQPITEQRIDDDEVENDVEMRYHLYIPAISR